MAEHSTEVQRLRTRAALAREERAQVEVLFDSLGEAIIATNEHGVISRVNRAALNMLGYKKKELIGQWFPEKIQAVHEDGSAIETMDRPIFKAFITGTTIDERVYYLTKAGDLLPVAISVSPIMLRGKPRGAIETFHDITAQIQNDKMKTDFISIASHQLRTPLTSIKTYTHMVAEGYAGDLNKTQQYFMQTILSATDRMNELITTLLNVTRIEAGTITIDSQPMRLDTLVKDVVSEFKAQVTERKIKLVVKISPNIPIVQTDKLLTREIVANLLSNAVKYTPLGGSVTVSLYVQGRDVVLQVHDTGYGIPTTAQAHIFSKFFRAPNVIERDVTGTGLGLYLIKILAERLNGEVWFKSTENYGTDFFFALPQKGSAAKQGQFRLEASGMKA